MYNIKKTKSQYIILFLILLLALLFRTSYIDSPNLYYDEHNYLTVATLFLKENISPWDTMQAQPPPLSAWINSVFVSIIGLNELSIRLVSSIFGTLTVLLVFLLAKEWYGAKYGLLASILLAVLPLHVLFSRLAFIDIMATFFIILTIYTYEKINKKNKNFILILTGIFLGLSILTKFSTLTLIALYFLFIFIYGLILKKYRFSYYKKKVIHISVICSIALFTILISTGFKIKNIFILSYGFIYLSFVQTSLYYDPFYYSFLILINALSPLIYILMIISIFYLGSHILKNRNKIDILLLFSVIGFMLIAAIQGRTSPRHLVLILPFIAILISRTLFLFLSRFRITQKKMIITILFIVILFPGLWSYSEISKNIYYKPWSKVGDYINQNLPENAIIKYKFPYFPISTQISDKYYSIYTPNKIERVSSIKELSNYDYFLIGDFSENSTLLNQEPIKGDINFLGFTLFNRVRTKPYPILENFVIGNSKLIETFYCNEKACLYLYQLDEVDSIIKEKEFAEDEWSIFNNEEKREQFFIYFCGKLEENPYSIKHLIPEQLIMSMNDKCISINSNN